MFLEEDSWQQLQDLPGMNIGLPLHQKQTDHLHDNPIFHQVSCPDSSSLQILSQDYHNVLSVHHNY